MHILNRKIRRDLWTMKGQVLAISLVVASGIGTFVMALTTLHSLQRTREAFYRDNRFGDVFVSLKRAPEGLRYSIEQIPGVARAETRVVASVTLDIPGYSDPASGLLISIPDQSQPLFNQLYLREGRLPRVGRIEEVVISEAFAEAHDIHPGYQLRAIINGRRRTLQISGVGATPEHIYQIRGGSIMPDFEGYGILWMPRTQLAAAYNMEGGFNDAILGLANGAQLAEVIDRLDEVLAPYGGLGSYGREDQLSHRYLSEEFKQLESMATIYPVIFMAVAAFLLHIVLSRLIRTQREQIATLKAFGYRNIDIGFHYLQLALWIVLIGVCLGLWVGHYFGKKMSALYMTFYRLPFLDYRIGFEVPAMAVVISSLAALVGTIYAVWDAASSPPAEAMRPEPPAVYRESFLERLGMKRWLSQPARMILRNITRRPFKFALSAIAISFAVAILMVGRFSEASVGHMVRVQFELAEREDLTVAFNDPTSMKAKFELERLPGVRYAESYRVVPVKLRFGHRTYRTGITGYQPDSDLHRLLDAQLRPIYLPPDGIVLTDYLAKFLGLRTGDMLSVEVLEGSRPVRSLPVVAQVSQYIGVAAYMDLRALNRFMREGNAISGVYLATDSKYQQDIYKTLKEMPRVASTTIRQKAIQNFNETMAQQVLVFGLIATLFASSIAFGVVYNSARIALSERSRELASLRVLGFTRAEISFILLGELAVLTLSAIPVGFVIGEALCNFVIQQLQTDLFRVPLVLENSTYAFAATAVLVSALISSLFVRHRLDHLDLVAVLKMKE